MNQLEKAKAQQAEDSRSVARLKMQIASLESRVESLTQESLGLSRAPAPTSGIDATIAALRKITEEALNDLNSSALDDVATSDSNTARRSTSKSPPRSSSRAASYSPVRGERDLSPMLESALGTVQRALRGRRMQVGELRGRISALQEQAAAQKRREEEVEGERRRLESTMSSLKEERTQL